MPTTPSPCQPCRTTVPSSSPSTIPTTSPSCATALQFMLNRRQILERGTLSPARNAARPGTGQWRRDESVAREAGARYRRLRRRVASREHGRRGLQRGRCLSLSETEIGSRLRACGAARRLSRPRGTLLGPHATGVLRAGRCVAAGAARRNPRRDHVRRRRRDRQSSADPRRKCLALVSCSPARGICHRISGSRGSRIIRPSSRAWQLFCGSAGSTTCHADARGSTPRTRNRLLMRAIVSFSPRQCAPLPRSTPAARSPDAPERPVHIVLGIIKVKPQHLDEFLENVCRHATNSRARAWLRAL